MTNEQILAEAKRIKKQHEKETGQKIPLSYFVEAISKVTTPEVENFVKELIQKRKMTT
jgi:predicted Zn-dependent peptidase